MKKTINQRQLSKLTGISLVVMTIAAGVSMGMVYMPVFEMGETQFAEQLPEIRIPLIFGILGWLVILICDFLVSWGLYKIYERKDKTKSKIMGILRLIYSLILMGAIFQLIRATFVTSGAEEVYRLLQNFQSIWQFGLIIFGMHLLYLAALVCEKKTIRQAISVLLFIAGIGYVLSNTADLFIVNYEEMRSSVEAIFILPMILGELGLAIWLLIKGGKEAKIMTRQCVSEFC